jgi:hypothetical protein
MREVGVIIGFDGKPLHWHSDGTSSGWIPDRRSLWEAFWDNRISMMGFAHSHPGGGVPGPSYTDLITFAAAETGVGKRLFWYIVSSEHTVLVYYAGPGRLDYRVAQIPDPEWAGALRDASNVNAEV